ncbi:MAG TPA: hypothetical protein VH643_13295 [Gemmataceae bacterium]
MSSTRKDGPQQMVERSETDAEGWNCCACQGKTEAEMLLDWLEANGYTQREVSYAEDQGFRVRWRK